MNPAGLAVSGEDIAATTVAEEELAGHMFVDSVDSLCTAVVTAVVVARKRKAVFVVTQNTFAAEVEE